jgi:hypothetical protein
MNHFPQNRPDNAARRAFLQRGAALSLAAGATLGAGLAAIGGPPQLTATDYKGAGVRVPVRSYGDYANTLVPYDSASG